MLVVCSSETSDAIWHISRANPKGLSPLHMPIICSGFPTCPTSVVFGRTKLQLQLSMKAPKLTNLTQSPLWLCHHAAANPEELLGQPGDGRLVPQLWRAHDGWRGRRQGAGLLFGLVSGAPDEGRREHARRQGAQRLEGGVLVRRGGQRRAVARPWRQRRHRWGAAHP